MTNFTKFLAVTFSVLLIITLLTGWYGGHSSSEALRTTVLDFNPTQVDRIAIENPNRDYSVVLAREGDQWVVENRDGSKTYKANSSMVENALQELNTLEINAIVARTPERHSRYHVDQMGTTVRLSGGGRTIGSLIVGRFHFQSQTEFYTYVRPGHSDDVFTVPAFLNATIARDIPEWRDKKIWELNATNISEVHFTYPADSSFTVQRGGSNIWISEQDTLNSSLFSSAIRRLADFSSDGFPAQDIPATEFSNEKYLIHIRMDGESRNIRLRPSETDENQLEAVADGYPYIFTLGRNRFINTVMKSRAEFLEP